jgi:putative intracellular protease/amidase
LLGAARRRGGTHRGRHAHRCRPAIAKLEDRQLLLWKAVQLTKGVPFLVEDELKRIGGLYEKAPDWQSFAIIDGRVITGQNPASSTAAAKALLSLFAEKAA